MSATRYEVHVHHYGRRLITRDGPAQGLLEWPQHRWGKITPRPLGLTRAKAIADEQAVHAVVTIWDSAEKVHDNGKKPGVPEGWWHPDAQHAGQPRRAAVTR
jgi:hypothetical protein